MMPISAKSAGDDIEAILIESDDDGDYEEGEEEECDDNDGDYEEGEEEVWDDDDDDDDDSDYGGGEGCSVCARRP
eukprot:2469860-Prymnesium_polylepis.1